MVRFRQGLVLFFIFRILERELLPLDLLQETEAHEELELSKEMRRKSSAASETSAQAAKVLRGLSYSTIAKSGLKPASAAAPSRAQEIEVSFKHPRSDESLCPFGLAGNCKYGDKCRYLHGIECPTCHKRCLHPFRPEEHDDHLRQCSERLRGDGAIIDTDNMECGICLEPVKSKPDNRFGLLSRSTSLY